MIATGNMSKKRGATLFTPAVPFITAQTLSSPRSDSDLSAGFRFQVGAANITVVALGRWVISGNSQTHLVKIVNASNVLQVSGTVDTNGAAAGDYTYITVTPTILTASTVYFILSAETNGGDQWYNEMSATSNIGGSITHSAYDDGGGPTANSANLVYVPVNFKYY